VSTRFVSRMFRHPSRPPMFNASPLIFNFTAPFDIVFVCLTMSAARQNSSATVRLAIQAASRESIATCWSGSREHLPGKGNISAWRVVIPSKRNFFQR